MKKSLLARLGLVNLTMSPGRTSQRQGISLTLNAVIGGIAVLFALASVGTADTVTPAQVLSLGLDPGYTWQYDPAVAPGLTHYYTLTRTYGTWEQTRTEAQAAGGDLVIINGSAENSFLTNEFASLAYTQDQAALTTKDPLRNNAWIGLSKPSIGSPSSAWEWVDTTSLSSFSGGAPLYFRWADNPTPDAAPFGVQPGNHAYLQMANHPGENGHLGEGYWNANDWHEQGHDLVSSGTGLYEMGIVESRVQGTPEPATLATLCAGAIVLLRRRRW